MNKICEVFRLHNPVWRFLRAEVLLLPGLLFRKFPGRRKTRSLRCRRRLRRQIFPQVSCGLFNQLDSLSQSAHVLDYSKAEGDGHCVLAVDPAHLQGVFSLRAISISSLSSSTRAGSTTFSVASRNRMLLAVSTMSMEVAARWMKGLTSSATRALIQLTKARMLCLASLLQHTLPLA